MSYDAFRALARVAFTMVLADPWMPPVPVPGPEPPPQPQPPSPPRPPPPPPVPQITGIECGIVKTVRDSAGLHVAGFVGTQAELDKAKKQADDMKAASFDVAIRPWPQCEVLMTLEKGLSAKDRPSVRVVRPTGSDALVAGSDLVIELETPAYPSYLQVAYIQADGSAITLVQPDELSLKALAPHTKLVLGDGRDGGSKFRVAAPYGNEIVVAIAGHSPLFATKQPQKETERGFLTALRRALFARPDSGARPREFGAAYDAVTTKEKP